MGQSIIASSIVLASFLLICTLLYYVFSYRNLKNSKKYYEEIHKNLEVGKNIEFCGGIKGKVVHVQGDDVEVKLSGGTVLTITRYVVTKIEQ